MPKNNSLVLSVKSIFNALIILTAMLVAASVAGQVMNYIFGHPKVYGLVPMFNVNHEQNIPTLFSVLLLITCSILLSLVFYLHRKQEAGAKMYWATLAIGFAYMAIDEFTELHENIGFLFKPLIGSYSLGFLYYSWVVPAMALMIFHCYILYKIFICAAKND